jgi:uncharacterized membrane protein
LKRVARFFAGPVMVAAGINHFVNPDFYLKIVPAGLPAPEALVYVSGVAEIVGALGTMHARTRRPAGWFLIATLVAVYPANVYMAVEPERFSTIPRWALLARLPLQFLFIYWVWRATLADEIEGGERHVADG